MPMREFLFAVLTAVAAALISVGAFLERPSVGLVVAGVLLAVWSWMVLAGEPDKGAAE